MNIADFTMALEFLTENTAPNAYVHSLVNMVPVNKIPQKIKLCMLMLSVASIFKSVHT